MFSLQIYPDKPFLRNAAGKQGAGGVDERGDGEDAELQPQAFAAGGVEKRQPRKEVQRLPGENQQQRGNAEPQEGHADLVAGFEEARDENAVEGGVDEQHKGKKEGSGVHQRVAHIGRRTGKNRHAQGGEHRHQREADELDEAGEDIFRRNTVRFFHRQQNSVKRVVRLSRVLKGVEHAEADEERPHQDGISGQQRHQRRSQKNPRQRRRRQPDLFTQQLFHTDSPFQNAP